MITTETIKTLKHTQNYSSLFRADPSKNQIGFYYGMELQVEKDGSNTVTLNNHRLRVSSTDVFNLLFAPALHLKKKRTKTFLLNGEYIVGANQTINIRADGSFTTECKALNSLVDTEKELRKLTRALRKNLQPRLRLIGTNIYPRDKYGRVANAYGQSRRDVLHGVYKLLQGDRSVETITATIPPFTGDISSRDPIPEHIRNKNYKKIVDNLLRFINQYKYEIMGLMNNEK